MGLLRSLLRVLFRRRWTKARARYVYVPAEAEARRGNLRVASVTVTRETMVSAVAIDGAQLTGTCWVIDGDTIDIGGKRIRLAGIDAPELDHPYGNKAKATLIRLCQGKKVTAVFDGLASYERSVATCYLPDGRDLSAEMVRAGMAIDWPKFSGGKYTHLEPDGVRRKLWRCDARQKGRMPPRLPD